MNAVIEKPSRAKALKLLEVTNRLVPELTLGKAADLIYDLREEKRDLDGKVKKVEGEIATLTEQIFGMLDKQDTRKAEGNRASISVNYAINPSTKDWDATAQWIINGKRGDKYAYAHLMYKRIAAPAYRELRGLGVVIPGQEDFTNRTLSITKL
jgi:hypothetical protein